MSHASIASITRPSAVGSIQVSARPDRPEAACAGRTCADGWTESPLGRRAKTADPEGQEEKTVWRDPRERGNVADIMTLVLPPTGTAHGGRYRQTDEATSERGTIKRPAFTQSRILMYFFVRRGGRED